MNEEMVFGGLLFATVAVLAYGLSGLVFRRDALAARLRNDLPDDHGGGGGGGGAVAIARPSEMVTPVMERLGHAAAKPFMPKTAVKQSSLRRELMYAGIYTASAMEMVVGAKVILLAAGLVVGYLLGAMIGGVFTYLVLYLGGVVGFLLPAFWLRRRISSRRRNLERALPDALDLLVVCVESGLTLDAAIHRVGQEIALAHPEISKEFGITQMETRVGLARIDAIRNLGQRTGSPALQSLAAMLVQTERFGTSIAQALRVHAESLRVKRQYQAEEKAQKAAVKLIFPVVLFIFPTLLVVLAGPAFILFFNSAVFAPGK